MVIKNTCCYEIVGQGMHAILVLSATQRIDPEGRGSGQTRGTFKVEK